MSSPVRSKNRRWINDTKQESEPKNAEVDAPTGTAEAVIDIADVESVPDSEWDRYPRERGRWRYVGSDTEYETDGEDTPRHVRSF